MGKQGIRKEGMGMQSCKNPFFTKGRVLKKESLDSLQEYPRELAGLRWEGYSDGILFGLTLHYEEERLSISKGAIRYAGEVMLLQEEVLPFETFDQLVSVKIRMYPKSVTEDFEVIPVEFQMDTRMEVLENELELGRFCLAKGAKLRSQYTGVEDFRTAYNTLDVTQAAYAGREKATLSPALLRAVGTALLSAATLSPLDVTFAFLCLNSPVVERDSILWYLSKRLETPFQELSNEEIYEKWKEIVGEKPERGKRDKRENGPRVV